jgi:glycosyltransferase involved in cell wall biosynthesis
MEYDSVGQDMKTASKPKKRAAKATPASAAQRFSGSKTEILLAARWVTAGDDDRIALRALSEALPQAGIAARLWRPFEDSLADCRCLHLFGTAAEFLPVVESAHRNGVKVVLSPESRQDDAVRSPYARGWLQKSAAWFRKTGRGLFSRTPVWQRELYAAVDLLLPNSNVEAQRIVRRFKLPPDHLRVVPHGVDPRLGDADPELFRQHAGVRDFVLYAGTIEPNNQQLGFLWAMKQVDVPVVMLGDVAPQCEWYLNECRRVAGSQAIFLPRLAADDPLLASAYAACGCLVAGSGIAPERIALAAGASGTPLVLFEGGSGSEYFGQQAVYIRPDDVPGIRRGVQAALNRKRSKKLAEHVCTYFSWKAVVRALRDAYGQAGRTAEKRAAEQRAAGKVLQPAGR